jgi:predicted dithiol-disulfide oxidoreductase (DUF899 family)
MMTHRKSGTRQEWLAARMELLAAEKAHTRRGDELAQMRRDLPWVRVEKEYRFDTIDGPASLADLFRGRSQLLIYHFMFGPDYEAGCPSCSSIADGFNGIFVHLENHDVAFSAVSRAPLPKLKEYERRMGWSFPWASSQHDTFNYDFCTSHTEEEQKSGVLQYNYRAIDMRPLLESGGEGTWVAPIAASTGTSAATYMEEMPGVSAFALEDGIVYHTYSAYARGLDALWGMYQWLDRAPLGRNEDEWWFRRHDEYGTGAA